MHRSFLLVPWSFSDFDVTFKDCFPGARLLWRRKIADCDKLEEGVISGGRLPCYVFSTSMYTKVSSTSGDNVVLLAAELKYVHLNSVQ